MDSCSLENVGHVIRHALSLLYKEDFKKEHVTNKTIEYIYKQIQSENNGNSLPLLIYGIISCPEIIPINYPHATKKEVALSLSTYFFGKSSLNKINKEKINAFKRSLLEISQKSTIDDIEMLIYYIVNYH